MMTPLCFLVLTSTCLAVSHASPVNGNMGFMRPGFDMWPREAFGQGRVRRQQGQGQGRPMRRVQGQRPDRRPRPQQEKFYRPKQRPLKPVNRQQEPVQQVYREPVKQVYQQEPVKQVYQEEPMNQVYQQEPMKQVYQQEPVKKAFQSKPERDLKPFIPEPQPDEEIYNEVERSYDVRPEPSQVYERSATVQDSLESESIAAPAEQRDIEAAVAAGAAGYAGESYAEPQRLSFQIHGQGGPNAYKFGYDTGVGYNRQFRYEERDQYGVLHGRYGYYDQEGKLQVVNYTADPKTGFHAEGDHVPKPAYR